MSNSDNPRKGAEFQEMVRQWFADQYKTDFELEKKIPIGFKTKKDHKFDVVSKDRDIVVECKRYTWTAIGNVPSAKMGFLNEAAFYLSFLPNDCKKFIVMYRSVHPKHPDETLAEYYVRMNGHLLKNTIVAEYDPATKVFVEIHNE